MEKEYVNMQRNGEVIQGVHVDAVPAHVKIGWEIMIPEKPKQLSAEEKAALKEAEKAAAGKKDK